MRLTVSTRKQAVAVGAGKGKDTVARDLGRGAFAPKNGGSGAMVGAPKTGYARLAGPDIFGIAMHGKLSAVGRANSGASGDIIFRVAFGSDAGDTIAHHCPGG